MKPFVWIYIHLFDLSYMDIYSCLYARLLDLYNLWVNDDTDRGLLSLSFFFLLLFSLLLLLLLLSDIYVSYKTAMPAKTIVIVCLYLTFIRIITPTTNNFLLFFSENDTYPFLHTYLHYIEGLSLLQQSEEKRKENSVHTCLFVLYEIKRRRSDSL